MSQPFKVYDKLGNELVMASPRVVAELVKAGELFYEPPVIEKKVVTKRNRKSPPAADEEE